MTGPTKAQRAARRYQAAQIRRRQALRAWTARRSPPKIKPAVFSALRAFVSSPKDKR